MAHVDYYHNRPYLESALPRSFFGPEFVSGLHRQMAFEILTTTENNVDYCYNRAFLESALRKGHVQFIPRFFFWETPELVFNNKTRVYDFTRSAKATIREETITFLKAALPGLSINGPDIQMIRGASDGLFNYQKYKGCFEYVGHQQFESMEMLIFYSNQAYQYVAHAIVKTLTCRTSLQQYTVYTTLTCQGYTYFPLQKANIEAVIQALQCLFV